MTSGEPAAAGGVAPGEALEVAREAGVHAIALPTPFLVGRVNTYLIEDDPLTLVDTGPNSAKSLDELEQALAALGYRVEDLGLIVLTHQHIDHVGLLEVLARRSGAEVAAWHQLAPYLADFSASARADDEFSMQVMLRHGVPSDVATALNSVGTAFRAFGSSGRVSVELREGDELSLRDRRFRVLHRPGHSPSDTVFFDEAGGLAFGGDHLLADISSNPLLTRRLGARGDSVPGGHDRPHALIEYMASMRATRELDVSIVLSGHGPPVVDHRALIDERLRMHDRRAGKLARMLEELGPSTAYGLASQMWGNVAVTQAYLTISEVLGHLDLLISQGRVSEQAGDAMTTFSAI